MNVKKIVSVLEYSTNGADVDGKKNSISNQPISHQFCVGTKINRLKTANPLYIQ